MLSCGWWGEQTQKWLSSPQTAAHLSALTQRNKGKFNISYHVSQPNLGALLICPFRMSELRHTQGSSHSYRNLCYEEDLKLLQLNQWTLQVNIQSRTKIIINDNIGNDTNFNWVAIYRMKTLI
jgi:hypothetical protein